MKKCILLPALALCLLLLAGCGKTPQTSSGNGQKPASSTQPAVTALERLQSSIAEKNCMLGVGFFGYVDSESSEAAVRAFAANSTLAQSYSFLAGCTPVLTQGAELYAFVPANQSIAITVCPAEVSAAGNYIDRKNAPIYTGKPGEAVVLRCNLSEVCANVLITATNGKNTLEYHPMLSMKDGHVATVPGCHDFTGYEKTEEEQAQSASELLAATDEVRDALQRGMKLLYTGNMQVVDGRQCLLFALGTEHEEQFVQEQLYAVSDDRIYAYSAVADSWEPLGAG